MDTWEDTIRDAVDKGLLTLGTKLTNWNSSTTLALLERRSHLSLLWKLLISPRHIQDKTYWANYLEANKN